MSYKYKFEQSDKKALNSLIATKILDLMDKLRLDANENAQRRWIWELLQNAKDVAFDNQPVKAEVFIEDNGSQKRVSFSHNGKPFSVDNITFLIKQVSTKERNATEDSGKAKSTGKFGTGFLTTHLLSEKVEVTGVVKEPDLDYRKFILPLDRSGRSTDEIIQSVNNSILVRDTLDNQQPILNYSPQAFNTIFRYNIDNIGLKVANIGIDDLHTSLPFTLVFLPSIKSVSVKHENITYELGSLDKVNKDIQIATIYQKSPTETKSIKIATLSKNNTTIAVEVEEINGKIYLKSFAENLPKLFCDFPLIGTEDFHLPVIINNPGFNPTEPRDGVWLTDHNAEPKILENKKIIQESVELYFILLEYASENYWQNLFYLAKTKLPDEKKWFSINWFKDNFQQPVRKKLLRTPIVDTIKGERIAIQNSEGKPNIWFPSSEKPIVRSGILGLASTWIPGMLPAVNDINHWYNVIWSGCSELTLKVIANSISNKEKLHGVAEMLSVDEEKAIEWLNQYYDLLNYEGKFIQEIINDTYAILPNQKGILKKRSELHIDKEIEEELKNTMQILGTDVRDYLLHKKVRTDSNYKDKESQIRLIEKTQVSIIEEINKVLKENKNANISKACDYLTSCFSHDPNFPQVQEQIYDFCKAIWDMPEKREIEKCDISIWQEVNKLQINWLIHAISENKNIEIQSEKLQLSKEESLVWLNSFVDFLNKNGYESQLNSKDNPILPNQNGQFCIKDDLFLDNGEIDESLKDILESLDFPLRNELLDKDIYLELPKNRERTPEFIADEISKLIKPKFAEVPRSANTTQIFKSLYLWFNKNKHAAENLFSYLYSNKHKLYDDDEVAANLEKAEILDEIVNETGLSPTEIKSKLKALLSNPNLEKLLTDFNTDISLLNKGLYPVGSEEDILISPDLTDVSCEKSRISVSEEAKDVIFRALRNKGFTIPESLSIQFTIVDGIISPLGKKIKLVVKSGKAGKIYFNPNEWLALTEPDSQLFVVTKGNMVRNITLNDIEGLNDSFHMRFNTMAFAAANLKAFAGFFRYLPYTHFIFDTPESTTDYLQVFGLNSRNPSSSELSADDKNLLH